MKLRPLAFSWLLPALLILGCGKLTGSPSSTSAPAANLDPNLTGSHPQSQTGSTQTGSSQSGSSQGTQTGSSQSGPSQTNPTQPTPAPSQSSTATPTPKPPSQTGPTDPTPTPTATTDPTSTAPTATAPTPPPPPPAPTGTDPYRWYPALDLATIPFHVADGPWGPRRPVATPDAPKTTRKVTVHTAAELQTAALVPGSEITVAANIDQGVVVYGDITDVDIIIPAGITTVDMQLGRYSPPSKTTRLRIRGTTPGQHSGGLVGQLTFFSPTTDLIIDGIDMNGEDRQGGGMLWYFNGTIDRAAVVNSRGYAVGAGMISNGGSDIVVAGCNFYTGARLRGVYTLEEGWGLRFHAHQMVIFRNRIDGNRYHRVRVHTAANETSIIHYSWISENTFVDPHEGRITTAMGQPGAVYEGFWAVHNTAYAYSTCMGPEFDAGDYTRYGRVTDNTFYGNLATLQSSGDLIDQVTGNTYHPWAPPPAWPAPGDPTTLPLPALNPAKCTNPDCSAPAVCPGPP